MEEEKKLSFFFALFSLTFHKTNLPFMLRNLSRTIKFNKNQIRAFHDCPTNAIQPLRLLLIGCPVSTLHLPDLGNSIHSGIRALEKEHNPADWKRTLASLIYPVVICFEKTSQSKLPWDNRLNNTSQMES